MNSRLDKLRCVRSPTSRPVRQAAGLINCSPCRGRLQGNAKVAPAAPEVQHDRVQDLPTSGFAAPVRGTNITGDGHLPAHVLESTETMARLDDLGRNQGLYTRPVRPERLIGRGWPQLGAAWGMAWPGAERSLRRAGRSKPAPPCFRHRLDELLSSLGTGMDGWDGDGVFAPDGAVGRTAAGRRKQEGAGGSTRAGGAGGGRGGADDHADWSRDGSGYFGGTAADYDAGVAPGSGLGGGGLGGGGQPMSQELEDQVHALKAALEAAKKKLARSRDAEGEMRIKHDDKVKQLTELKDEKLEAEREKRQAMKAAAEAARQAAAKKRAAKRSRLLSSALPEGDEDGDADLAAYDVGDDADLPRWRRLLRQWQREVRRRQRQLHRWWERTWPLRRDIAFLEARYGSSVSVYFVFVEWICVTGVFNLALWMPLLVAQMSALVVSNHQPPKLPTGSSSQASLLPWEFFQFSAYRTNEALLYYLVVGLYVLWYVVVSYRNVAAILRKQIYLSIFEADTRKMRFARSLFTSWECAPTSAEAAAEQRLSTLSDLRAVIHEADWRQEKAERPLGAQRKLLLRQGTILTLHLAMQVAAWYGLLQLQMNIHEIQASATGTRCLTEQEEQAGATGCSSPFVTDNEKFIFGLIPKLLIGIVNATMPEVTKMFSKLARWDNPEYTRMHMLFGYYFGRTVIIFLIAVSQFQTMQQQSDYYASEKPFIDNLLATDWVNSTNNKQYGTLHGTSYVCVQVVFAS